MSLERKSRTTSSRPPAGPPRERDAVFAALAARLPVKELEEETLSILVKGLAGVTALVRIGTDPRPSRVLCGRSLRSWTRADESRRILACPVGGRGDLLGFVGYVRDGALEQVLPAAEARLVEIADLLVAPARNSLRYAQALEMAHQDPLTGLCNRRAFADHLEREEQRAARSGRPLSVILLDLDRLKEINDRWGHETGDRSLCTLAEALVRAVRRGDIVARLGGDEFAVLLPDTRLHQARRIALRIQQGLAARRVTGGAGGPQLELTVSVGVAEQAPAGDPTRMIEQADAELFASKRSRRTALDPTREAAPAPGDGGAAPKKEAS